MVVSCTNWDLKFKEKPLILFSLCLGSKYSCLSQDRIGVTAVGDKEVKSTNSVKDQWKLLTQEGPAAEISWITQLNKLSGKSIWISSSWATVWYVGQSLSWAGRWKMDISEPSWRKEQRLKLWAPKGVTEGGAAGVRAWCGSRAGSSVLLSPCSGRTEAVIQGPLHGALQAGAAGEGPVNPESSRCRNERGNHNCK